MAWFSRKAGYDRTRILDAAARARARGRRRKAIALYRRVLAVERENAELHWKLAPLLAETGQDFDAWQSFKTAARDLMRRKRVEQALGAYREASRHLPREIEAWQATARLERKLARHADAVETLLEGRRAFRGRGHRPQAVALLRAAREIDPWEPGIVLDLARLLGRMDQADEAHGLLDELAGRSSGRTLCRVRGAQWRLARTVAHTWLWLRAALAALREDEPEPAKPDNVLPLTRPLVSSK